MACANCSSEITEENFEGLGDLTDNQWLWLAVIVLGFGVILALNK